VIRGTDVPEKFNYLLCGHIHRAQVLTRDLRGNPLAAPVVYPGSIERTSFAERNEDKGYMVLDIHPDSGVESRKEISFVPLPARPMVRLVLRPGDVSGESIDQYLRNRLATLDRDAVVSVKLDGSETWINQLNLSAQVLRELAPSSMNISLASTFRSQRTTPKPSGP
jgi:DNA repair exonuclease SbcCD nuclease subunit